MSSPFDIPIDRGDLDTVKLGLCRARYLSEDLLPMWVADMDFAGPDFLASALADRAAKGCFGYTMGAPELPQLIAHWQHQQHGWSIDPEAVLLLQGVVPSMAYCLDVFTQPGDAVVVQPPVYYPFYQIIEARQRQVWRNPLRCVDTGYEMDLDHLEALFRKGPKAMLLCSPHNPIGLVWPKNTLRALGELALRHEVLLIVDEIHADLVFEGSHTPIASLSPALGQHCITLSSPGKSFNMPGLGASFAIIPNAEKRRQLRQQLAAHFIHGPNLFGLLAMEQVYREGRPWLTELLAYLKANIEHFSKRLTAELPQIGLYKPQGGYLMWLDFRRLGLSDSALKTQMVNRAKLGLSAGIEFGPEGSGFMRINLAAPRRQVDDAAGRLIRAFG